MDISSDIIQILGFIVVLGGVTLILTRVIFALTRGNRQRIRLGVEILVALAIIYWFASPALTFIGMETSSDSIANAVAFLWVISFAFVINAVMNQFLWVSVLEKKR